MADYQTARAQTGIRTQAAIDEGLKAHMNKVYGTMSVGMVMTALAAWAISGLAVTSEPTAYQIGADRFLTDLGYALYALDHVGHVLEVRVGVDAARDGQAGQLQFGMPVPAGGRVAAGADDAALHRANTRHAVELGGERLRRKVLLRHVRQNSTGVQEHGVPANRQHNRNARIPNLVAQVLDLADSCVNMVIADALGNADRESLHIAARHATIGVQTLVNDDHGAGALVQVRVVHREEAADIDHRVIEPEAHRPRAALLGGVGHGARDHRFDDRPTDRDQGEASAGLNA